MMRRLLGLTAIMAGLLVAPSAALAATSPAVVGQVSNSTSLSGVTSVAVSGNHAYTTAYWPGELTAIDISNPSSPTIAGSSGSNPNLQNGTDVTIAGHYAFVTSKNRNLSPASNDDGSGNSLTIVDISIPTSPTVVGTVRDTNQLFGAYGVAVSGHYAYVAYQGHLSGQPSVPDTSTGGFSVIDITVPSGPTIVANIDNGSLGGHNYLEHATSVAISGNDAYVTAFYDARLTVIDISNPTSPAIVTSLRDPTNMPYPNNVAVSGSYAYVASQAGSTSVQLAVVNISNPAAPLVVGSFSNSLLAGAYTLRVRNNFVYVVAVGTSTMAAVDVSNPASPRLAGFVQDPGHLFSATGLDVDSTGGYVVVASPRLSTESGSIYPPFPTNTGTISDVQLDPSPISVSITPSSEPPNPTSQTTADFSFSVSDQIATVACKLDGAPFGACTTPTSQHLSSLANGNHTFTVQATDAAGHTATDSYSWSVIPAATPPQNTTAPTVSGTTVEGQTLTEAPGTWTGGPTSFAYQWQDCDSGGGNCANAPGARSSTYLLTTNDVGHTIRVLETATGLGGSTTASSAVTAVVTAPAGTAPANAKPPTASGAAPANAKPPTASGAAVQHGTLTGGLGSWSGNPTPSLSAQWVRCNAQGGACRSIGGATHTSYTLTVADVGSRLRLSVRATNVAGSAVAQSAATAVVKANPAGILAAVARRHADLRLTVSSVSPGSMVAKVLVALPRGLAFATHARRLSAGIRVTDAAGGPVGFAAVLRNGSLVLTLKRDVALAHLTFGPRALVVSDALATRVRSKKTRTLTVTVTLTENGGRRIRSALALRVG